MKFIYGKNDFKSMERGQENCYLLTNGLGGFSSLTMIGSNSRNDHALLMSCTQAPNHRYHMITRTDEALQVGDEKVALSSQEYVNHTKNQYGFHYLQRFSFDTVPAWLYQAEGVELNKTIVMQHGTNAIGIRYQIENRTDRTVQLSILPQMQFVEKGSSILQNQSYETTDDYILSNNLKLHYKTNASVEKYSTEYTEDLYYSHDARDGRDAVGKTANNHRLLFTVTAHRTAECFLIYSMDEISITIEEMLQEELRRQELLAQKSQIKDAIGLQLVKSADQFIVDRESTKGKSIIAGYPFFTDWGRDTMIAMVGCCISTKRYDEAKSIFRTFMKYCSKGLMPNMFPEGGSDPLYNTVDASLLFIAAVYEYYVESGDQEFITEAFSTMVEIIEYYKKGTDYHIKMDQDGLIMAGNGLEQVTWMDVRYGDILPTPRHGKPVEINAYWYNALRIMGQFSRLFHKESCCYDDLADKVKESFHRLFWSEEQGCLWDVISGGNSDHQIRCNQIWAVSLPFTMLTKEEETKVVDKVFEKLYTPYGLRSLDKKDKDFKPKYGGSLFERDMAYHQGTALSHGGLYERRLHRSNC